MRGRSFGLALLVISVIGRRYWYYPSFLPEQQEYHAHDKPSKPERRDLLLPRIECKEGSLRDCVDHTGVRGEWVPTVGRTFAAPVCCAWQSPDKLNNDPERCVRGEINRKFYRGKAGRHQQIGGRACSCSKFNDEHVWEAPGLPDFDPRKTCDLLGTRQVLLIGDSTMQQTASTMMNALVPAGCQGQLLMTLSDTLTGRRFGASHRGATWQKFTKFFKPDIVIISTGAHVYSDEGFMDSVQDILSNVTKLREDKPDTKVVWKTQNPGGCSTNIRYSEDPAQAGRNFTTVGRRYQHADFYDRDLYAIDQMQKHGVPVLDMRMLYSRSDAHPTSWKTKGRFMDCMHMCSPGL